MEIDNLITLFEQKLMIQRYSTSSIKNYSSSVNSFLQVAAKKFEHPNQLSEQEIEKYILWKIEKHKISSSYQRFAALRSGGIFSTALDTKNHSSNLAQIFIRRTSPRLTQNRC